MSYDPVPRTEVDVRNDTRFSDCEEGSIPTNALFEMLACRHRRYALSYIAEQNGAVLVSRVISYVTKQTESHGVVATDARIATAFHHTHFPKLAAAGLITYDTNGETVEATERTSDVKSLVEMAIDHDRR